MTATTLYCVVCDEAEGSIWAALQLYKNRMDQTESGKMGMKQCGGRFTPRVTHWRGNKPGQCFASLAVERRVKWSMKRVGSAILQIGWVPELSRQGQPTWLVYRVTPAYHLVTWVRRLFTIIYKKLLMLGRALVDASWNCTVNRLIHCINI